MTPMEWVTPQLCRAWDPITKGSVAFSFPETPSKSLAHGFPTASGDCLQPAATSHVLEIPVKEIFGISCLTAEVCISFVPVL